MQRILYTLCSCLLGLAVVAQDRPDHPLVRALTQHPHLVALWDFDAVRHGDGWEATVPSGAFALYPQGDVTSVAEGPLSGHALLLDGRTAYLSLPHETSGALDVKTDQVTVMAWVNWSGGTGFVAGKWNEYSDGGKRQYGLFVSLPYYNGADRVCGHISKTGMPTDPFPFSIDYSASAQRVPKEQWVCVAFTYDGGYIWSYLDGVFRARGPERIDHTAGFLRDKPDGLIHAKNPYFYPYGIGDNASDFTVGAVLLKTGMGNFFKGMIGGLAVFDRALSPDEMSRLAIVPQGQ